jgi:toxin ParE1/3/4
MSARDLTLVITPLAVADLREIYVQTVDRWGEEQADRYEERIRAAINHLARNPRMGHRDRRAEGGVRSFSLEHHTIYYRTDESHIYIMRVAYYRQEFRSSMLVGLYE